MKQKAGPAVIVTAVVLLIGLMAVLYRQFFPPLPPPDIANPKGMPGYAKMATEFIKNHKPGDPMPQGMPGAPGQGKPASADTSGKKQ